MSWTVPSELYEISPCCQILPFRCFEPIGEGTATLWANQRWHDDESDSVAESGSVWNSIPSHKHRTSGRTQAPRADKRCAFAGKTPFGHTMQGWARSRVTKTLYWYRLEETAQLHSLPSVKFKCTSSCFDECTMLSCVSRNLLARGRLSCLAQMKTHYSWSWAQGVRMPSKCTPNISANLSLTLPFPFFLAKLSYGNR